MLILPSIIFSFKILFIYFEREGKGGEREGEKHQCVVASHVPPTGDLAHNPGMCLEWELNQQPFGSQTGTQSTEPLQLGLPSIIFNCIYAPLQLYFDLNRPLWASLETLPLFIRLFQLKQKQQVPHD